MPLHDAALLLLGHGSTLNADSSAPTHQHAEEIRRRRIFAEVQVGFWKEEPNFRQALRQTDCQRVYVVPNFISSGYFTEQIIPRELGLDGAFTQRAAREIVYCEPVGLHPAMRDALLGKARDVVAKSAQGISHPEKTACLFICGHGTSLNDNSTKIIHAQAEAIRALGLFADCQPVLMEQAPFVKDWRTLTTCPDVIVVPFFIADGLHSFEDIPVLLGLTGDVKEAGYENPHVEDGRRLWYATAIGTEKFLADIIIAQVERAEERFRGESAAGERGADSLIEEALGAFVQARTGFLKMGQVIIGEDLELRHSDDAGESGLRTFVAMEELREWVRWDDRGDYRPLLGAPSLRRGWRFCPAGIPGLRLALDCLYPAELANWVWWRGGRLPVTPWAETAARQSGRFRIVREVDGEALGEMVKTYCGRGCMKARLWAPAGQEIGYDVGEVPLLCPEACNFLVGKAREKLKGPGEE